MDIERLESAPLTDDDYWIWVRRAPHAVGTIICDRRDAAIMLLAQRPDCCPCCGARYASLQTQTGGFVTVIDIRPHRGPPGKLH